MTVGRRGGVVLLALALVLCLAAAAGARSAAAAEVEVGEGALTWGMKASWRAYAGPGVRSDDVSVTDDGEYVFPLTGGSYDAETGVTRLAFSGSVHWQRHWYPDYAGNPFISPPPGYSGPLDIFILDVAIADPEVTISAEGSTLTAHVVARTPDWQLTDLGRVALTNLDVSATTPTVADGTTTWSQIPSSLTSFAAKTIFGGQYPDGTAFDPVSIAYEGPGGAPDLSENLSEPGAADIEREAHTILWDGNSSSWSHWWTDDLHGVVHASIFRDGGSAYEVQAFDTSTMQPLGQRSSRRGRSRAPPASRCSPTPSSGASTTARPTTARWTRTSSGIPTRTPTSPGRWGSR
jgi:hypothetical protein